MPELNHLNDLIIQVRRDILRQVHKVNSGHPGGSLGCTEFFVALFQVLMNRKEGFDMDGIGEDIFFLSNGHISPVFTAYCQDRATSRLRSSTHFAL